MRPRVLAAASAAGGVCLIVATVLVPALRFAYANQALHVAVETAAVIVGSLVAFLAFGRYRRDHLRPDLLIAAGLGLFVVGNIVLVLDAIVDATHPIAGNIDHFATWVLLAAPGVGAALLAGAAVVAGGDARSDGRSPRWIFSGAAPLGLIVLVSGIASGGLSSSQAPSLASSDTVHVTASVAISTTLALAALLFGVAAVGFVHRAEQEYDEFIGWMAAGCTLAALASLSYVLFPPLNPRWFYTADLLRLGAYLLWLVGGAREIAHYWSELAQLAVTEERRRMARDLHDGMAQELAFITTQATSAARGNGDPASLVQLGAAAQRALDESRRAIAALTTDDDGPLAALVTATAEDVASRYGMHVHVDFDEELVIPPKVRETLLWIVREAVTNAARHGGARAVTIDVRAGNPVSVCVRDDGAGFDLERVSHQGAGFGLVSMRERAAAIGAAVTITSSGAGTTVELG